MLNDSGIEIKDHVMRQFIDDSCEILHQLKGYVLMLNNLKDFGRELDRLMNLAYALSLNVVGDLARYGKEISFKSERIEEKAKLFTIQSLLAQLIKKLERIMVDFSKNGMTDPEDLQPLLKRLALANNQLDNYA